MSDNDFVPFTPALGITGSSYQLQLGRVNEYWAIRLVKGKDILASKVYNDVQDPDEIPLGRLLTGWVLSVLAIPNINTYQIQKVIGFLRQKGTQNFENQKDIRQSAGKSERTDVKLEKVPENVQVKRHRAAGWVKEETQELSQAEAQAVAKVSPALAASNVSSISRGQSSATIKTRKLPEIPRGDGFTLKSKTESTISSTLSANIGNVVNIEKIFHSDEFQRLLKRVEKLEFQFQTLEEDNLDLRNRLKNRG